MAEAPIETSAGGGNLAGPAEAEVGGELAVAWSCPSHPGDCLAVVAAGAAEGPVTECVAPTADGRALLTAPVQPGGFEVRYLSGRSAETRGRLQVAVIPERPKLRFAAKPRPGSLLEVSWSGPDQAQDYLAVAPAGAPEGTYLGFVPTAAGSPCRVRVPEAPGDYELRYVSGQGERTLSSAPFTVAVPAATLAAPATAMAGTRIEVTWTGPDRTGDLVSIAPLGSAADRIVDWAYTSDGNPLTVAAPDARDRTSCATSPAARSWPGPR